MTGSGRGRRLSARLVFEKAGETANIRRMSASFCDPANAQAVGAVAQQSAREAEECRAAKKIELLCND